ncbi:nucleoside phosphorylase [Clostridium sp. BNL1100]|uniref:5'-methylthioadenosine/S-adenosylhomocysteine nucleosidase family protein n=1 Tax=Clostridium sp. BNL1100 TaxID=755731 RepID=UPI00024A7282|nr:nucleoside phosphorylase [Clostridium sp. BNL1100]AEY65923.1 nucleoside phosphorylase [Clostridium sp. BNL1100]
MIFIVTALMLEAAPIIDYFKLKKDMTIHPYSVYKGSDITFIVSGVGKLKSAMASVYLYTKYGSGENNVLINIGFCGTNSKSFDTGSLLVVNKVTDMDTGKDYYPDVFFGDGIPQIPVECYPKVVKAVNLTEKKELFCDMESAGIMEASKKFFFAHNVLILKIISDYLEPDKLDKAKLKGYIEMNMPILESIIKEMRHLNEGFGELPPEEEKDSIEALCLSLRFTQAMKLILTKEVKRARINGLEPLSSLKQFNEIKANSKEEGKKYFEYIIAKIKQKSV